jgi:hypothetical protein
LERDSSKWQNVSNYAKNMHKYAKMFGMAIIACSNAVQHFHLTFFSRNWQIDAQAHLQRARAAFLQEFRNHAVVVETEVRPADVSIIFYQKLADYPGNHGKFNAEHV